MAIDRRFLITAAGAALLSACQREGQAPAPEETVVAPVLDQMVDGAWRVDVDKARDVWRHPAASLAFWGLTPGMTVVEVWPGAGWYTDIIAPFLQETGGVLYAALQPAPEGSASAQMASTFRRKITSRRRLYGRVEFSEFGPSSGALAPDGEADLVLFLRNIHNWMAGGFAEKAFADAFAALKPGGILGVEEHRANPGGIQDITAADGYVQEAWVVQLAAEAGFRLDETSEINANPNDDRDHPFGVWTLPPTRLTAPRGQPADPTFDRASFDQIGESDRMTLRFVKPGA